MTTKPDEFRLPIDVRPTHYDLTVQTDLETFTFNGLAKIELDVKKETSSIVFNTAELDLKDASIYSDVLKTEQVETARSFDTAAERVTLQFSTPLPAGSKARLSIGFAGKLTTSMMGYYKSSYEHEGKTKNYALTQFEPTAARRAFPCWDEPLLKATFAITMISRDDTINLSNMPVVSEKIWSPSNTSEDNDTSLVRLFSSLTTETSSSEDKWKISQFMTTPLMSTYVVAFANGDFSYLESSYTTQFALDIKAKVLPLYEKVFDIEYPLPKLDTLVAHDFDAGAMENWGLITGRTSAFLLDPARADMAAKKRVTVFESHEIAHMWFGNITTMEWWDYLYLNEGLIFPEWKVDSEFITLHLNDALNLDAKVSSHPVEVDCPDANQINQIFDSLSYAKAASVLRMLSNYVGEERFLKGVSLYLKKRLYGNSVTRDLWEGIAEATGIDVTKMMDNWITKIGFPVLTVTETKDGIRVRQDRFLETGPAEPKDNETIWSIPLSLLTVTEQGKPIVDHGIVLDTREKTIAIDTTKPFKLNAGTSGVYRVLYSDERVASIAEAAAKSDAVFSLNDRIGLVHDVMVLSKAGFSRVSSALTVVDTLRHEKEFLVWDSIAGNVATLLSAWWEQPRIVELLNKFRQSLYGPIAQRLGYDYAVDETADTTQLRTRAIEQAARAGDARVIGELKSRFAEYMKTGDDSKIPADLFRITLIVSVKHGGREEYEFVKQLYEKSTTPPSASTSAMYAMGSSENEECLRDIFDYILTNARDQDLVYFFAGLRGNNKTRRRLAKFFKDNYDTLYARFEGNFSLKYIVEEAFGGLSTEEDYEETVKFFKDKDTSKYNLALEQTLDSVRATSAWLKWCQRSTTDILEWLEMWDKRE
ncbi:hypothetical protein SERLADRAFT_372157 [Serpula lacrymans var. lacrymans S7.9]|uniref:Aminopeptidase n=1 Tax=Serpula lacrymans var. lacrymans (strain S7.9) TaxID=578457 RepID=F8P4H1_SERL9|nr:uncharacterized protein SERLADRAFT_372157 [Serpula lacrymans var. lacrymans S7.9]EGO21509.1 hypothetical protein SERLADRAFT_372157 [Serpula lacrymans var. lacrymans S7.9]